MRGAELIINTKINNTGITTGLKGAEKQVASLTNQFNKQVESIKRQELAVEKLKHKYQKLQDGGTENILLKNMQIDLNKSEKEAEKLDKKLQELQDKLRISGAEYGLDTDKIRLLKNEIELVSEKLSKADTNTDRLKRNIEEIKLNPSNTFEAQELAKKIELANEKLENTKKHANELREKINEVSKVSLERLGASFNKLSNGFSTAVKHISKLSAGLLGINKQGNSANNIFDKMFKRIAKLALAVFIFNQIRKALSQFMDYMRLALNQNDLFVNSVGRLKRKPTNSISTNTRSCSSCNSNISKLACYCNRTFGTIYQSIIWKKCKSKSRKC